VRLGNITLYDPYFAIDGNPETYFGSRYSGSEMASGDAEGLSWWQIDLTENYHILAVYISAVGTGMLV